MFPSNFPKSFSSRFQDSSQSSLICCSALVPSLCMVSFLWSACRRVAVMPMTPCYWARIQPRLESESFTRMLLWLLKQVHGESSEGRSSSSRWNSISYWVRCQMLLCRGQHCRHSWQEATSCQDPFPLLWPPGQSC